MDWTRAHDGLDAARFDALQSLILIAMVAHCGMLLGRADELGWWARTVLEPAFLLSCIVGLGVREAKPWCVLASFGVASLWLALSWPSFANHTFLEWSVLLLLVLCRGDEALGMRALRWLPATVLFHSGFQKLVMGDYFQGQFLAFVTAGKPKFSDFFGLVLSDAEFSRLVAMKGSIGTGPYSITEPLFLAMSNMVWIGEMAVGVLLLYKPTRRFAVWAAVALIAGIELGARELIFGSLFTYLVLMFYEGRRTFALWPVLGGIQILAMLAYHFLPGLRLN
jgi:hypothetical protein